MANQSTLISDEHLWPSQTISMAHNIGTCTQRNLFHDNYSISGESKGFWKEGHLINNRQIAFLIPIPFEVVVYIKQQFH